MRNNASKDLNKIFNDKTSGSTEIVLKLNDYFHNHTGNLKEITSSIKKAKEKLSHFAVINNYLNNLQKMVLTKDFKNISNFTTEFKIEIEKKYQRLFKNSRKYFSDVNYILTLSNSTTLLEVFKRLKKNNKRLRIVVAESRPKNEGRLFAQALIKNNIKVEFITDAMISLYIPQIDAVVLGADAILRNGNTINKTGSKSAALLCTNYNKPCYVITTQDKFTSKNKFKQMKQNPDEVWKFKGHDITVINYYFEEIEKQLITKIITD